MACRTMQLRLFKLGTVLTYAFKLLGETKVLFWHLMYQKSFWSQKQIFVSEIFSCHYSLHHWATRIDLPPQGFFILVLSLFWFPKFKMYVLPKAFWLLNAGIIVNTINVYSALSFTTVVSGYTVSNERLQALPYYSCDMKSNKEVGSSFRIMLTPMSL